MSQEAAFLDVIRNKPDDDVTRLVYADWLDEQGDALSATKSAYIRLECRLAELSEGSDEYCDLLTRRIEYAKKLTNEWLAVVGKFSIENCLILLGNAECPKWWHCLQVTTENTVRFCAACKHNVQLCTNITQAKRRIQSGYCVALVPRIARKEGDVEPGVRRIRSGGSKASRTPLPDPPF